MVLISSEALSLSVKWKLYHEGFGIGLERWQSARTKEATNNSVSPVIFQCKEKFWLAHHLLMDLRINGSLIIPKHSSDDRPYPPCPSHQHCSQPFWICDFSLGWESQSQNAITKVRWSHNLTFAKSALKSLSLLSASMMWGWCEGRSLHSSTLQAWLFQ